ncbi:hypothetical protein OIU74_026987 [Salix koriyanagi]|uniref:Uncharacterized protein n=1 Tax=Salix koriyanagi TaxID=2511006 RepID=A0A9Q0VZF7_9ROSI|nr:hypothetical protein OIU74_026987 [Salix koriyanagi]
MPYDYNRGPYTSHEWTVSLKVMVVISTTDGSQSNYSSGWEQRPPANMQGLHQHGGGYDYYSGQGGHVSEHPASAPLSAPLPGHVSSFPCPFCGGPPSQVNYNYGQSMVQIMGIKLSYSQAALTKAMGMDMMNRSMHGQGKRSASLSTGQQSARLWGSNMASSHHVAAPSQGPSSIICPS